MKKILLLLIVTLTGFSCSESSDEDWEKRYVEDVNEILQIVKNNHPGYVDVENPDFKRNLIYFFKNSLSDKKHVVDYTSYKRFLKRFVNSFKDKHMLLYFPKEELEESLLTSNIYADYINGRFIIREADETYYPALNGWKILKINDTTASEYFKVNVLPYEGNETIASDWIYYAPKLLIHHNVLNNEIPKTITVEYNGEIKNIELVWNKISNSEVLGIQKRMTSITNPEFGIKEIESRIYWLSLPSFQLNEEQKNHFFKIKDKLSNTKDISLLVIDLRGNDGGNSAYGDLISNEIYGKSFTEIMKNNLYKDVYVEYRTSKSNSGNIRKFSAEIADKMDEARRKGKELYRYNFESDSVNDSINLAEAIAKKVIVITDVLCFSSCLDFMDLILSHPNTVHVGLPTGADSQYIENTYELLPSKMAGLSYSMKVYRNRHRKANQAYIPHFMYNEEISNIDEIQFWILKNFKE